MARKIIGIRRRNNGWRADIRVNGHLYAKQFHYDTELAKLKEWREEQRDTHGGGAKGSFEADVTDYLSRVSAMPSYTQRAAHLKLWVKALGKDRPRRSIKAAEIDCVLQDWLAAGLSPVTVRHRRTALQSLFVKLDGKAAVNPVRGSSNPRVPPLEARGTDYRTIATIIAAMPAQRSVKPGAEPKPALGKLRVAVLAFTGMPPGMLRKLQPAHVHLAAKTYRQIGRLKGQGTAARDVPLTADGVRALRAFQKANAYGTFAIEALNRSFQRAATCAGVTVPIRLYDLRHSFGRELYRLTRDLATVARFLGHAPGSPVTARYAMGANDDVDTAAIAAFNAARMAERKSPSKLSERKKPRRRNHLRKDS